MKKITRDRAVAKYGNERVKRHYQIYNTLSKYYENKLLESILTIYKSINKEGWGTGVTYILGDKREIPIKIEDIEIPIFEDSRKKSRKVRKGYTGNRTYPNDFYVNKPLIYIATNKINNKIYVGITKKNLANRISTHKSSAESQIDNRYVNNTLFNKAIRKYGFENFEFEIIQFWDDKKTLHNVEDTWILNYQSWRKEIGYNRRLNNISLKNALKGANE